VAVQSEREAQQTQEEELVERAARITQSLERTRGQEERLDKELRAARRQAGELEQQLEDLQVATAALEAAAAEAEAALTDQRAQTTALGSEVTAQAAIVATLENELRQTSPQAAGTLAVLEAVRGGDLAGIRGRVRDVVQIQTGYEACIWAALGEAADWIVTDTTAAARLAVSFLHETQSGTATFLPLDCCRHVSQSPEISPSIPALRMIHCAAQVRPALELLLANVLIVQDLETAWQLLNSPSPTALQTCVTPAGEKLVAPGIISGGRVDETETAIIRPDPVPARAHRAVLQEELRAGQAALERALAANGEAQSQRQAQDP
jgi:chromosome segregation protein